jgi:hypothetical protein
MARRRVKASTSRRRSGGRGQVSGKRRRNGQLVDDIEESFVGEEECFVGEEECFDGGEECEEAKGKACLERKRGANTGLAAKQFMKIFPN